MHSETVACLSWIAETHQKQGQYREAESILIEARMIDNMLHSLYLHSCEVFDAALCGGRDGDVILPASSLCRCVCSKVDSGQSTTPCLSARLLYAQAALPFRLLISAGHAHRIIELVTGDKNPRRIFLAFVSGH